jgi:hypothetical protein
MVRGERMLCGLADQFGSERVWHEGLEYFGYPVTFDLDVLQVVNFRKYLEEKFSK